MPIKVRCSHCEKVLNAPDQARGKAVRCPACKTTIRVPAATAARKKAPAPAAGDDEDFLRRMDVSRVAHQSERVCPKCAAEVGPDDIDCPECGVNVETGVLSEEQRRVRERVGPDPALFYSRAWSNSWAFLKKNKILAFRTAAYWTIFIWNAGFFGWRTYEAVNRAEVSAFGRALETGIWGGVTFLCVVGMFGWYWYLTIRVTQATLEKQKKIRDLHFDIHQCMALGVKAVIWPVVLMTPVIWAAFPFLLVTFLLSALAFGESILWPAGIAMGCLALFPYLSFPVATAHMTMPYTYKAWLPVDMVVLFFKNIGATLYWWLMVLVLLAPFIGYVFLLDYFFGEDLGNVLSNGVEAAYKAKPEDSILVRAALACAGMIHNIPQQDDWPFLTFWWIFAVCLTMFVIASFTIPLAFPAVFLARANAMFTYYRSQTLGLVTHTKQGELAGFWVRYLAFMIDQFIIFVMLGIFWLIFKVLCLIFVDMFEIPGMWFPFFGLTMLLCVFAHYMYYVRSEVGNSQGTFGKSSLGLIVTNMDGSKIKLKTARSRWFYRTFLTPETFYLGYLMVLFTKDKQTLHDSLTKTKVVWEGDRE